MYWRYIIQICSIQIIDRTITQRYSSDDQFPLDLLIRLVKNKFSDKNILLEVLVLKVATDPNLYHDLVALLYIFWPDNCRARTLRQYVVNSWQFGPDIQNNIFCSPPVTRISIPGVGHRVVAGSSTNGIIIYTAHSVAWTSYLHSASFKSKWAMILKPIQEQSKWPLKKLHLRLIIWTCNNINKGSLLHTHSCTQHVLRGFWIEGTQNLFDIPLLATQHKANLF